MFTAKQQPITVGAPVTPGVPESSANNPFIHAGKKQAATTFSGNGALKYSSTGNPFVDQFGMLGKYKAPRSFEAISTDISTLWANNPLSCVCMILYIRMITRIVSFFDGLKTSTVQRGAGLKHEGIMRMIWLHVYHPETFWKNLNLFVSVGSWKDVISMLNYDLQYNGWNNRVLDWENLGKFLLAGLENPKINQLIIKYLPAVKANSQCKTIEAQSDNQIAKWLCSLLYGSKSETTKQHRYKLYRKLKSSGTAHQWQQLISQGKHNLIDFDTIHGRALALLVSGKYITNQGLEAKYEKWIESKPVAKFTGYVHELFAKVSGNLKMYQEKTINSQFMGLIETAKTGASLGTSMIVVRDTSGSMVSEATGTNQSCYDIGKALALFFSYMLPEGAFANAWIEFASSAKLHTWVGTTPVEKWRNDKSSFYGSTNFESVIDLFGRIKMQQGVSEDQFPTGILCISDMEFNPHSLNVTNVEGTLKKLRAYGFSENYISNFKIVLWNLQSNHYGPTTGSKFETYGNVPNVYYFSGYDGSIIAFLTGVKGQDKTPQNAEELFNAAMDQEVMKMIQI
jgi:hypothetical protein